MLEEVNISMAERYFIQKSVATTEFLNVFTTIILFHLFQR